MATNTSDSDRGQSIVEWLQVNSKLLGIAAAAVVVAAAFYWFYTRSVQIKAENAERSLLTAQQSLASGNAGLARSDLEKVINRYGGTSAGGEAALLLAQLNYDQGKYQDGIDILKKAASGGAPAPNLSSVYSLMADGYAQEGRSAEAAREYEHAAGTTSYPNEKAFQQAKAARSFVADGDTAQARKMWSALVQSDKAPAVAAEARVRLAELQAKAAGRTN